jgi:hypothetical protein
MKPVDDKEVRLIVIMQSIKELGQVEEAARYGVELNMRSREYSDVVRCAKKLEDMEIRRQELRAEATQIQIALEDEAKADLL